MEKKNFRFKKKASFFFFFHLIFSCPADINRKSANKNSEAVVIDLLYILHW